jgi:hypothetical protein
LPKGIQGGSKIPKAKEDKGFLQHKVVWDLFHFQNNVAYHFYHLGWPHAMTIVVLQFTHAANMSDIFTKYNLSLKFPDIS